MPSKLNTAVDGPPLTDVDRLLGFRLHGPRMKLGDFLPFFGGPPARAAGDVFPVRNALPAVDLTYLQNAKRSAIADRSPLPAPNYGCSQHLYLSLQLVSYHVTTTATAANFVSTRRH